MKRTELKRTKPMERGASNLRRTGRIGQGRKSAERAEALKTFRDTVIDRAGNRCERCGARPDGSRVLHAHHLCPRGRGGTDDPSNGAALCWICHSKVHDHTAPDWRRWLHQPIRTMNAPAGFLEPPPIAPGEALRTGQVRISYMTTSVNAGRLQELITRTDAEGHGVVLDRALGALERELGEVSHGG